MGKTLMKCVNCGNAINFRYRAMPQWNISGLCGECYGKKLTEYYISTDRRDITKR